MAFAYPSGNPGNTFVPSFEASGQLVVSYSRNPKDFPVNQYITLVPVKRSIGYYLQITAANAARLLGTGSNGYLDGSDIVWADGAKAPLGYFNTESFSFQPFLTTRFCPAVPLGYKAVEQSSWKIQAFHAAMLAQQAMTLRTARVVGNMLTSANWPSTNTSTFQTAATNGGSSSTNFANLGTPTNPLLKFALDYAAQQINLLTLGVVRPKDLLLVLQPNSAARLADTQEVHTYLQQQVGSIKVIKGEDDFNPNEAWGLPRQLYGYKIVVEDGVQVTTPKGVAVSPGYIMSNNSAVLMARPGSLVGVEGAPSFSTIHLFSYEEMTVESMDDTNNRRHLLRVVDDYDVRNVSNISGYLFTNLFS